LFLTADATLTSPPTPGYVVGIPFIYQHPNFFSVFFFRWNTQFTPKSLPESRSK
jgi:hypothetical protein